MTNKNHYGVVMITGASAGIGRELALEFVARAETLVLVSRRLERREAVRQQLLARHPGIKIVVLTADLSDERPRRSPRKPRDDFERRFSCVRHAP